MDAEWGHRSNWCAAVTWSVREHGRSHFTDARTIGTPTHFTEVMHTACKLQVATWALPVLFLTFVITYIHMSKKLWIYYLLLCSSKVRIIALFPHFMTPIVHSYARGRVPWPTWGKKDGRKYLLSTVDTRCHAFSVQVEHSNGNTMTAHLSSTIPFRLHLDSNGEYVSVHATSPAVNTFRSACIVYISEVLNRSCLCMKWEIQRGHVYSYGPQWHIYMLKTKYIENYCYILMHHG